MNTIVKSHALLFALALITSSTFSQADVKPKPDAKPKEEKKEENIIIRKKGDSKEKLTVIIDGDKVTVNGKPVDEYKSDNVDIIKSPDIDMDMAVAPVAPIPPDGSWEMFGDDFVREIHSNKAFLGVMTKKTDAGAQVTEVTKESAAEKAGLKVGDVITKINDDKITDADDLYAAIGKYKPEDKVNVTYTRDGKETTIPVTLDENKQVRVYSWKNENGNNDFNYHFKMPPGAPYARGWRTNPWDNKPRLGIQVQDTEDGKGVKVLDVDEDEAAGKAGIEEDDIITQLNGKIITSVDILKENMQNVKKGDTIKITYLRNGKTQTADIKFPKDLKTTDL